MAHGSGRPAASGETTPAQRELAHTLLSGVGRVEWVEGEHLIDAVTAVSGSGAAYLYAFVEALEAAGADEHLSKPISAERLHALEAEVLALVAGVVLARRLTGPIRQLQAGAERLGQGDLTQRITRSYDGTFGQVKDDANATSEKLAAIIDDVGRVFGALSAGDLSQRIQRQPRLVVCLRDEIVHLRLMRQHQQRNLIAARS